MIRSPETCACPIREVGPSMAASCGGGSVLLFMSLLEAFLNGRCDLADPCRRVRERSAADPEYDFVVVGGGTAGAVVAARLSENPAWKVLLLEAGGDEPTASSVPAFVTSYWNTPDTDWMYHTEPQRGACLAKDGACYWPRGKMLGGCSVINGMMYMRGHAADYDGWAARGATDWAWRDVLPHFLRSEDNKEMGRVSGEHHSVGGPLPVQRFRHQPQFAEDVVRASLELGLPATDDLNGQNITGFTVAQALTDGGSRVSTARAYLRPAAHRDNLHVLLHALGARVLFRTGTTTASGVEYFHLGRKRSVRVKKEVVLSAGAINSPQLLLLSGVGPRAPLDALGVRVVHELPGVGQNLQNHVGVNLEFTLDKEPDEPLLDWSSAMDYMLMRDGPMASTGMSQLTGIVNSKYAKTDGQHPDVQFFFSGYYAGCAADSGELNAAAGDDAPQAKRTVGMSVINLHPISRGYLALNTSSPFDPPVLQPNYFLDSRDLDVLVDAAKLGYRLANSPLLRKKYGMTPTADYALECQEEGPIGSDEFLRCLARRETAPENHQVGTCAIGPVADPVAVVDHTLQVHGLRGVRVIDASVMPTLPSGNTAAPVIMIAERGAEFIITKYQQPESTTPGLKNRVNVDGGSAESAATPESPPRQWSPDEPWGGGGEKGWHGQWGGHGGREPGSWEHGDKGGWEQGPWGERGPWRKFQHSDEWHRLQERPAAAKANDTDGESVKRVGESHGVPCKHV